MTSESAEPAGYWTLHRLNQHRRLILLVVLTGAILGGIVGFLKPPVHTAEARLAVGTGSMSDLNIPGFPTASIAMAANYARWVNAIGVPGGDLPAGTLSVSASPFPQSNVIRVEATAKTSAVALRAVNKIARDLREQVNAVSRANDADALLDKVTRLSSKNVEAQSERDTLRASYDRLRRSNIATPEVQEARAQWLAATERAARMQLVVNALQDRYRRLVSNGNTEADLSIVGDGGLLVGNSRSSDVQRFSLLGSGLGLFLALLGIRLRDSRRVPHA